MHKVDLYLLKNSVYIFLLANIIAFIPSSKLFFPLLNALALGICLLLFFLIRTTVRRYSREFGREQGEVKDLLGRYIEDDKRGKVSFYEYLRKRLAA
jgi:MFS superfamily sulfate permease-like transporter